MEHPVRILLRPNAFWRRFLLRWQAHRHSDNAAALTFYSLVSLVPILLVGLWVSGGVLGEKAAIGELGKQLSAVIGPDAAQFIAAILRSSRLNGSGDLWAILIIPVALFFAGSHVLAKLRETLNLINEVEPMDPSRPLLARLFARGLCAALLLLFGALLVVGTLVEGFLAYFADHFDTPFIDSIQFLRGYQLVSTYLLLAMAFFAILKILPRRRPGWGAAAAGAVLSAAAVGSLKGGLDLYLRHSPLASIFGTGLTVLVFLYWLFLSIQAFLAGAEVTAMLMRRRDRQPSGKDERAERPTET